MPATSVAWVGAFRGVRPDVATVGRGCGRGRGPLLAHGDALCAFVAGVVLHEQSVKPIIGLLQNAEVLVDIMFCHVIDRKKLNCPVSRCQSHITP